MCLDIVNIYSRTVGEHLTNIPEAVQRLHTAGVTLVPTKCIFLDTVVSHSGHTIRPDPLEVDKRNLAAIERRRDPTNPAELPSFLDI